MYIHLYKVARKYLVSLTPRRLPAGRANCLLFEWAIRVALRGESAAIDRSGEVGAKSIK